MPVLLRSQARARHPLAYAASSRVSPPKCTSVLSSELGLHSSLQGGINCGDRAFGGCLYTLAVGNEGPLTVPICTPNFLNCLATINKRK